MKNVKIRNTSEPSMAACLRRRGKWLHVSQWFKPVERTDECGVTHVDQVAQSTRPAPGPRGTVIAEPHGQSYNAGKNALKRLRRRFGFSLRDIARMQQEAGVA